MLAAADGGTAPCGHRKGAASNLHAHGGCSRGAAGQAGQARPKLVVVDDLPHAAGPEARRRLAAALGELAATARFPVVVVATEAAGGGGGGGAGGGRGGAGHGGGAGGFAHGGLHKARRGLLSDIPSSSACVTVDNCCMKQVGMSHAGFSYAVSTEPVSVAAAERGPAACRAVLAQHAPAARQGLPSARSGLCPLHRGVTKRGGPAAHPLQSMPRRRARPRRSWRRRSRRPARRASRSTRSRRRTRRARWRARPRRRRCRSRRRPRARWRSARRATCARRLRRCSWRPRARRRPPRGRGCARLTAGRACGPGRRRAHRRQGARH
jgi:hypothetical protein